MQFKSHIQGKNADVRVFPDRIEWGKKSWMSTGAKVATGVVTVGLSLPFTGVKGRDDREMILLRSVTSVTSSKGVMYTVVSVIAAGNTIDFKCSNGQADPFKDLVLRLVRDGGQPQQGVSVQVVPQVRQAPPSLPAGWYPDPTDARALTWWDGQGWRPETKHYQ